MLDSIQESERSRAKVKTYDEMLDSSEYQHSNKYL